MRANRGRIQKQPCKSRIYYVLLIVKGVDFEKEKMVYAFLKNIILIPYKEGFIYA